MSVKETAKTIGLVLAGGILAKCIIDTIYTCGICPIAEAIKEASEMRKKNKKATKKVEENIED